MMIITDFSAVCNLGESPEEIFNNACRGVLREFRIDAKLPVISDENYNLRCNRILLHCVNRLKDKIDLLIGKYGKKRVGIVIANANTGIDEFEDSENPEHIKIGNPAEFLKKILGLEGFYCAVSTACSSGIKVFSTAERLLENDICDAVIAGGCDGLSRLPIAGFSALEVVSETRSIPFSKNRSGMNISEAGALFVLEKEGKGIKVLSTGETSDAYHASTPEPEGIEAARAMELALSNAGLKADDIDYVNLHGTGTKANDLMEANAIYKVFADKVPVSATKPLTGHCLGAAASIETALCCAMLEYNPENYLLPHIYDGQYDNSLPQIRLAKKGEKLSKIQNVICTAFGFGGTNAVIILGK